MYISFSSLLCTNEKFAKKREKRKDSIWLLILFVSTIFSVSRQMSGWKLTDICFSFPFSGKIGRQKKRGDNTISFCLWQCSTTRTSIFVRFHFIEAIFSVCFCRSIRVKLIAEMGNVLQCVFIETQILFVFH